MKVAIEVLANETSNPIMYIKTFNTWVNIYKNCSQKRLQAKLNDLVCDASGLIDKLTNDTISKFMKEVTIGKLVRLRAKQQAMITLMK